MSASTAFVLGLCAVVIAAMVVSGTLWPLLLLLALLAIA